MANPGSSPSPSEINPSHTSPSGLLKLAALCAGLVILVTLAASRSGWLQNLDQAALAGGINEPPMVIGSSLNLLATISLAGVSLLGAFIGMVALMRGQACLALGAGALVLGSYLTTQLLRGLLMDRPAPVGSAGLIAAQVSLPSSHATIAMSLALALILVAPRQRRLLAALLGGIYATGLGTATLTAGWHRPSEVVVAYLVATAWGAIAAAMIVHYCPPNRLQRNRLQRTFHGCQLTIRTITALGILLFAFCGVTVTLVALSWGDLQIGSLSAAYWTGLLLINGSGLLLITTFLIALRNISFVVTSNHLKE